jgi:hypothetical protein
VGAAADYALPGFAQAAAERIELPHGLQYPQESVHFLLKTGFLGAKNRLFLWFLG